MKDWGLQKLNSPTEYKNGKQSQANDDKTEEIDTSIKKNVKFKINPSKRHSGNLRKFQRPNL